VNDKKIIYGVIAIVFLIGLAWNSFFSKSELIISCNEIDQIELTQKQVSKPYLRTIDVIKINSGNREILIQSNDDDLVPNTYRSIKTCNGSYTLTYYKNEKRNGSEVYFISKPFFQ
jgi:hypothetical protein